MDDVAPRGNVIRTFAKSTCKKQKSSCDGPETDESEEKSTNDHQEAKTVGTSLLQKEEDDSREEKSYRTEEVCDKCNPSEEEKIDAVVVCEESNTIGETVQRLEALKIDTGRTEELDTAAREEDDIEQKTIAADSFEEEVDGGEDITPEKDSGDHDNKTTEDAKEELTTPNENTAIIEAVRSHASSVTKEQLEQLYMRDLQKLCAELKVGRSGRKQAVIKRILTFLGKS